MTRVVNCPCVHTLTGENDEALFVLAKQHSKEHHPDSSEEIRLLVTATAKDA